MNKRLQQFLSAENISQSQFADNIKVGRASVSHILAGRNKPGYDFIENLARYYPDLNRDWLLLGKGKMLKSRNSPRNAQLFEDPEFQDTKMDEQDSGIEEKTQPLLAEDRSPEVHSAISKIVVFYSDGTFKEIVWE